VGRPPLSEKDRKDVRQSLVVLFKALQIFGLRAEFHEPTLEHWCQLAEAANGDWMKTVKYKLNAFYAVHESQPLPKAPWPAGSVADQPHILIGGAVYRFLRMYKAKTDWPCLLQTIKRASKGMPRASEKAKQKKVEEYITEITTPPKSSERKFALDWHELDENFPAKIDIGINHETAKEQIKRTIHEIFQGESYTLLDRQRAFFPSTSANYINNVKAAGAIGSIIDHSGLLAGLRSPGGALETRTRHAKDEEEQRRAEESWQESERTEVEETEFERRFATLWYRILKEADQEVANAEPVALAEALKIRIITKGPPFTMTALRPLWKKLHTVLRQHPTFCLIGEVLNEGILLQRLGYHLRDDEVYLSGDYESATDKIHSWASEYAADCICDELKLEEVERRMLKKALTGHILRGRPQRVGQLMGSIVSFPLLCILNATMCRWAIELAERQVRKLVDCRMLINGDDVVIRSKEEIGRFWRLTTSFIGFVESVGKSYVSRSFLEINSTRFDRTDSDHRIIVPDRRTGEPVTRVTRIVQTPYVNMGLLLGLKRSQGKAGLKDLEDPRNSVGHRARELLRTCPEHLRHKTMSEFLNVHRNMLNIPRIPWFVPEWLGGFGIPSGDWGEPSELDRRQARAILLEWKKRRPIALGRPGAAWHVWELAERRMPKPHYSEVKGPLTELYDSLVGKHVVNLLFDSRLQLNDLRKEVTATRVGKALRHNSKIWTPKAGALPQPMSDTEMQFRRQYTALPPREDQPDVRQVTSKPRRVSFDLD